MGKEKARRLYYRGFINKPKFHSTAFILVNLQANRDQVTGQISNISGDVVISDCNRQIDLCFDCYYEEDRQNALEKCDKLIKQLRRVRDFLASSPMKNEDD